MRRSYIKSLLVVFFCSSGWIYADSAIGADAVGSADSAAPATQPAAQPATPPQKPEISAADDPGQREVEAQRQAKAAAEAARAAADAAKAATSAGVVNGKPAEGKIPDGQSVKVGALGQIDLHVKDLDLAQVLQLLSIQSQRNIVASRNVSGNISADLYGVDFYQALDAILKPNGFTYREKGNFIYVYSNAEVKQMDQADLKPVFDHYRLNYLTAADASTFVTPLLSSAGSLAVSGTAAQGYLPSVSDGGANSRADADLLIIKDYPDNVAAIKNMLAALDVRPKQVLIEATVLEANLKEDNSFGVDLTFLGDMAISQFTTPLSAVQDIISGTVKPAPSPIVGAGSTSVGQTGTGTSSAQVGIVSKNIAAFVKALDSVTHTITVANPKLLVLNRQRADLLVGQKLGYVSTTTTDTSATQTVEFLDVGTQLTVRPFISDDGYIRMELRPSISDGSTTTVGNLVIPNTTTQQLTTNVMVRDGQTIIIGGLYKEDTTIARRQVPVVGDVPLVGLAFKGQDDTVNRNEIIFLITPTIVKDQVQYVAGERAMDAIESTKLGARAGLLPFSRTRLTASHMRDAVEAYQAGDKGKALWYTEEALSLNPTLAEAYQLKEKITGSHEYWPSFSILQDAMDKTIENQIHSSAPAHAPEVGNAKPANTAAPKPASSAAPPPAPAPDQHALAPSSPHPVTDSTADDAAASVDPMEDLAR